MRSNLIRRLASSGALLALSVASVGIVRAEVPDLSIPRIDVNNIVFPTITGTASVTNGSNAVTGVGTLFTTEVEVGDRIHVLGGGEQTVAAIADDTNLTTVAAFGATSAGAAIRINQDQDERIGMVFNRDDNEIAIISQRTTRNGTKFTGNEKGRKAQIRMSILDAATLEGKVTDTLVLEQTDPVPQFQGDPTRRDPHMDFDDPIIIYSEFAGEYIVVCGGEQDQDPGFNGGTARNEIDYGIVTVQRVAPVTGTPVGSPLVVTRNLADAADNSAANGGSTRGILDPPTVGVAASKANGNILLAFQAGLFTNDDTALGLMLLSPTLTVLNTAGDDPDTENAREGNVRQAPWGTPNLIAAGAESNPIPAWLGDPGDNFAPAGAVAGTNPPNWTIVGPDATFRSFRTTGVDDFTALYDESKGVFLVTYSYAQLYDLGGDVLSRISIRVSTVDDVAVSGRMLINHGVPGTGTIAGSTQGTTITGTGTSFTTQLSIGDRISTIASASSGHVTIEREVAAINSDTDLNVVPPPAFDPLDTPIPPAAGGNSVNFSGQEFVINQVHTKTVVESTLTGRSDTHNTSSLLGSAPNDFTVDRDVNPTAAAADHLLVQGNTIINPFRAGSDDHYVMVYRHDQAVAGNEEGLSLQFFALGAPPNFPIVLGANVPLIVPASATPGPATNQYQNPKIVADLVNDRFVVVYTDDQQPTAGSENNINVLFVSPTGTVDPDTAGDGVVVRTGQNDLHPGLNDLALVYADCNYVLAGWDENSGDAENRRHPVVQAIGDLAGPCETPPDLGPLANKRWQVFE